jgi:uncharacterized protein YjbI with pentapeptide repeats
MKKILVSAKTVLMKKPSYAKSVETISLQDALEQQENSPCANSFRLLTLENINFIGRKFNFVDFERVSFIDVDFRNADFKNTNFYYCTFVGVVFNFSNFKKSNFHDCNFHDCVFENLYMNNVCFLASYFNDVIFENINTANVEMTRCSILGSSFINFKGFVFCIYFSILRDCKLKDMYEKWTKEENKKVIFSLKRSTIVDSSLDSVEIKKFYMSYIINSFLKDMYFFSPVLREALIRCETTLEDVLEGVYPQCKK